MGKDSRGDNLVHFSDGGAHCFSCGYHEHAKHYTPKVEQHHGPKSLLPFNIVKDVPGHAWRWLLQYGLPYSYWEKYIAYAPEEERLVFKVGQPLWCSLGRHTPANGEPDRKKKWKAWGDCHKGAEIIGEEGPVVFVEDIISAHKVGQVARGVPLFGTELHPAHIYYAMSTPGPYVLWLDNDQRNKGYRLGERLSSLCGQPVKVVFTDEDPKTLSLEKINETIRST